MSTIRVVLGEDGYFPRQGIERALQSMEDVSHIGTHPGIEALREAIHTTLPDVVVTNPRAASSASEDDLVLVSELRDSCPEVGVLVLTEHTDPVYVRRAFATGIDGRGCLVKDGIDGPDTLRTALSVVAAGYSYLDPVLVAPFLDDTKPGEDWIDRLTAREAQILATVSEGLSNHAIAHLVGITTRGVERHISNIFTKLGLIDSDQVNRRVKAARLYLTYQPSRTG
jgi:DNA-binding NarL/FixJ family response regulator